MAEYIQELAALFGCASSETDRNDVAEAIRLWYVELPQATRNNRYNHTSSGSPQPISKTREAFFKAIKRIETDSNVFLFEELPSVFGAKPGSPELLAAIREEKSECDEYLVEAIDRLALRLVAMFDPSAHEDATLGSVLRDWVDKNPSATTHVFSGINNQVLNALMAANGDDRVTVNRLAKAATSLRIDDWNDARFEDFLRIVRDMKAEVEGATAGDPSTSNGSTVGIVFIDGDGVTRQKTFDVVECSGRSRLLKNSILACLSEMGGALRPEEKRQIVFEVLEGLC